MKGVVEVFEIKDGAWEKLHESSNMITFEGKSTFADMFAAPIPPADHAGLSGSLGQSYYSVSNFVPIANTLGTTLESFKRKNSLPGIRNSYEKDDNLSGVSAISDALVYSKLAHVADFDFADYGGPNLPRNSSYHHGSKIFDLSLTPADIKESTVVDEQNVFAIEGKNKAGIRVEKTRGQEYVILEKRLDLKFGTDYEIILDGRGTLPLELNIVKRTKITDTNLEYVDYSEHFYNFSSGKFTEGIPMEGLTHHIKEIPFRENKDSLTKIKLRTPLGVRDKGYTKSQQEYTFRFILPRASKTEYQRENGWVEVRQFRVAESSSHILSNPDFTERTSLLPNVSFADLNLHPLTVNAQQCEEYGFLQPTFWDVNSPATYHDNPRNCIKDSSTNTQSWGMVRFPDSNLEEHYERYARIFCDRFESDVVTNDYTSAASLSYTFKCPRELDEYYTNNNYKYGGKSLLVEFDVSSVSAVNGGASSRGVKVKIENLSEDTFYNYEDRAFQSGETFEMFSVGMVSGTSETHKFFMEMPPEYKWSTFKITFEAQAGDAIGDWGEMRLSNLTIGELKGWNYLRQRDGGNTVNLVENGNFQTSSTAGLAIWKAGGSAPVDSHVMDGWMQFSGSKEAHTYELVPGIGSTSAIKVYNRPGGGAASTGSRAGLTQHMSDLMPGQRYKLSFDCSSSHTGDTAFAGIGWQAAADTSGVIVSANIENPAKQPLHLAIGDNDGGGEDENILAAASSVEHSFVMIPYDKDTISPILYLGHYLVGAGNGVTFDNVKLEKIPQPATVLPTSGGLHFSGLAPGVLSSNYYTDSTYVGQTITGLHPRKVYNLLVEGVSKDKDHVAPSVVGVTIAHKAFSKGHETGVYDHIPHSRLTSHHRDVWDASTFSVNRDRFWTSKFDGIMPQSETGEGLSDKFQETISKEQLKNLQDCTVMDLQEVPTRWTDLLAAFGVDGLQKCSYLPGNVPTIADTMSVHVPPGVFELNVDTTQLSSLLAQPGEINRGMQDAIYVLAYRGNGSLSMDSKYANSNTGGGVYFYNFKTDDWEPHHRPWESQVLASWKDDHAFQIGTQDYADSGKSIKKKTTIIVPPAEDGSVENYAAGNFYSEVPLYISGTEEIKFLILRAPAGESPGNLMNKTFTDETGASEQPTEWFYKSELDFQSEGASATSPVYITEFTLDGPPPKDEFPSTYYYYLGQGKWQECDSVLSSTPWSYLQEPNTFPFFHPTLSSTLLNHQEVSENPILSVPMDGNVHNIPIYGADGLRNSFEHFTGASSLLRATEHSVYDVHLWHASGNGCLIKNVTLIDAGLTAYTGRNLVTDPRTPTSDTGYRFFPVSGENGGEINIAPQAAPIFESSPEEGWTVSYENARKWSAGIVSAVHPPSVHIKKLGQHNYLNIETQASALRHRDDGASGLLYADICYTENLADLGIDPERPFSVGIDAFGVGSHAAMQVMLALTSESSPDKMAFFNWNSSKWNIASKADAYSPHTKMYVNGTSSITFGSTVGATASGMDIDASYFIGVSATDKLGISIPEIAGETYMDDMKLSVMLRCGAAVGEPDWGQTGIRNLRFYNMFTYGDVSGVIPEFPQPYDTTLQPVSTSGMPGELGHHKNTMEFHGVKGAGTRNFEDAYHQGGYLPSVNGITNFPSTFSILGPHPASGVNTTTSSLTSNLNTLGLTTVSGHNLIHPSSLGGMETGKHLVVYDALSGMIVSSNHPYHGTAASAGDWDQNTVQYIITLTKDDLDFINDFQGGLNTLGLWNIDWKASAAKLDASTITPPYLHPLPGVKAIKTSSTAKSYTLNQYYTDFSSGFYENFDGGEMTISEWLMYQGTVGGSSPLFLSGMGSDISFEGSGVSSVGVTTTFKANTACPRLNYGRNVNPAGGSDLTSPQSIQPLEWFNMVTTISPTEKRIYINGTPVAVDEGPTSHPLELKFPFGGDQMNYLTKGSTTGVSATHFAMWNKSLGREEVAALSRSPLYTAYVEPDNLKMYAPMDRTEAWGGRTVPTDVVNNIPWGSTTSAAREPFSVDWKDLIEKKFPYKLYNLANVEQTPVFRLFAKKALFPGGLQVSPHSDYVTIIWTLTF